MEEIIWIMVLMSAGISAGVLTVRFLARSHAFYDVLRIEGGCLMTFYHGLCGSTEERYAIDEIRVVRFFCRSTKGNLTFMGEMQIVKKDGQKSRRYVYDGSSYLKKMALCQMLWCAHHANTSLCKRSSAYLPKYRRIS